MSQQSAFTVITFRRLPQGESIQITVSGNKALNILKDKTTGTETPSLTPDNPLVLTPTVYGTSGTKATLSNVKWQIGATASLVKDVPSDIGFWTNDGVLSITSSPIGKIGDGVIPFLLVFTATATLNGHEYAVTKTLVLNCSEVAENSYWGSIEASNGTTLGVDGIDFTVCTPKLYIGAKEVETAYTVTWYKTGAGASGKDLELTTDNAAAQHVEIIGNSLKVTRDAVASAAHFEAHFFVGGNPVEAEGISIVDILDELQVVAEGDNFAAEKSDVSMNIKAYVKQERKTIPNVSCISVVASDSIREHSYPKTIGGKDIYTLAIEDGACKLTSNESVWRVPNEGSDKATKPWLKCGDDSAHDVAVANIDDATKCEITFLVGVTLDL